MEQILDGFGGEQHFDHARPVVGEGGMQRLASRIADELPPFVFGERCRDAVAVLTRASGPTLYQPASGPRAVKKGNFM